MSIDDLFSTTAEMGGPSCDRQIVFEGGADGPRAEIDHAASARENLRAAGSALRQILPDNTFTAGALWLAHARLDPALLGLSVVLDPVQVVALPFSVLKDAADAAIHGVASLFE